MKTGAIRTGAAGGDAALHKIFTKAFKIKGCASWRNYGRAYNRPIGGTDAVFI